MSGNSRAKITRREFTGICVSAAAIGTAPLEAGSQLWGAPGSASSIRANAVDQNPIRRRGTGLRALDAERASAGLTLFAAGDGTVYLIDLAGKVVHNWRMPYPPGLYGYLTEKGTLFYNGQIRNETFLGKSPFKGGAVLEADWNGKVLWEVRQQDHHHDGRLLKNGNVLLLCATELPDDLAKKVQGGRPGTEVNGKIWADYLLEMTRDGRTVWEWRAWEHLDPAKDVITVGKFSEYLHYHKDSSAIRRSRLEVGRPATLGAARAHTSDEWQHPHL
jgi:hypothetical protein